MKALIVDDSQIFREGLMKILKEFDFKDFVEAEDGREALKKLSTENISIVFLDWEMPKLNGFEVLKTMRANDSTKDLPVFMVTSHAEKERIISAIKVGISGYLVKPFEKETVKVKLLETGILKDA